MCVCAQISRTGNCLSSAHKWFQMVKILVFWAKMTIDDRDWYGKFSSNDWYGSMEWPTCSLKRWGNLEPLPLYRGVSGVQLNSCSSFRDLYLGDILKFWLNFIHFIKHVFSKIFKDRGKKPCGCPFYEEMLFHLSADCCGFLRYEEIEPCKGQWRQVGVHFIETCGCVCVCVCLCPVNVWMPEWGRTKCHFISSAGCSSHFVWRIFV